MLSSSGYTKIQFLMMYSANYLLNMHTDMGGIIKKDRKKQILSHLEIHNPATLTELCEKFSVSLNTIRRDVGELTQEGKIHKIYGGILKNPNNLIVPLLSRQNFEVEAKLKIANVAKNLINENDCIFIDAGSTTFALCSYINNFKNLTIISNNLNAINKSLELGVKRIISVGGELSEDTVSFLGSSNQDVLNEYNISKCFISATGLSLKRGLTNSSMLEKNVKVLAVTKSQTVILLVDHTKFDYSSVITFARIEDVDIVITDSKPSDNYIQYFKEKNIELIIAK